MQNHVATPLCSKAVLAVLFPAASASRGRIRGRAEGTGGRGNDEASFNRKSYKKRKRSATEAEKDPDLKRIRIGVNEDTFEIQVPNLSRKNDPKINQEPTALKLEDTLSIFFANINGLSTHKINRLKFLTENDHILCLNETNYSENECIILTNSGLGDIASIKSCDNITYKKGKPVGPSHKNGTKRKTCRKKSGFGCAMVSKISKGVTISKNSGKSRNCLQCPGSPWCHRGRNHRVQESLDENPRNIKILFCIE